MANILFLKDVMNTFCTTMDTSKDPAMFVNMGNDIIMEFMDCGDGIYYFNTSVHYRLMNKNNNLHINKLKEWEEPKIYRKP